MIKPNEHLLEGFYVVTMISNPVRYESRYKLYRHFKKHMEKSGVKLITVELAFGYREFEITHRSDPFNVQLRTDDEIWHKENAINLGIARLPEDWKYVAWIDADIDFLRPDWAIETIHQLQHHQVVQIFDTALNMGPKGETLDINTSFGSHLMAGRPMSINWKKYHHFGHPGFAWAARREAIEHMGGLLDKAILGAADHHMSWALIGKGKDTMPGNIHPNYREMVLEWERRAEYCRKDVGFVPGTIIHHWHGKKKDRKYIDRWDILIKNQYDPFRDVKRDWQGLFKLEPRRHQLRDDVRRYFRGRNEDSVDIE